MASGSAGPPAIGLEQSRRARGHEMDKRAHWSAGSAWWRWLAARSEQEMGRLVYSSPSGQGNYSFFCFSPYYYIQIQIRIGFKFNSNF
jgi:hypothetical protein